jgi:hypothetical protein
MKSKKKPKGFKIKDGEIDEPIHDYCDMSKDMEKRKK